MHKIVNGAIIKRFLTVNELNEYALMHNVTLDFITNAIVFFVNLTQSIHLSSGNVILRISSCSQ